MTAKNCITHHACDCHLEMAKRYRAARVLVEEQAEEPLLWRILVGPEEYELQQALRKLHAVLEWKTALESGLETLDRLEKEMVISDDSAPACKGGEG